MKNRKKFPSKAWLRAAVRSVEKGMDEVERIRDHFDMEWGDGAHSDLDVALTVGVVRNLEAAQKELNEILAKFQGRAVRPNFPRKRAVKKDFTVAELQRALCC